MKIVQAPTQPIQALHRCCVTGTATPEDAGKSLVVSLDGEFKMTGPPVNRDGSWRLDLIFPRAGDRHLSVSVGDRKADVMLRVIENGQVTAARQSEQVTQASPEIPTPPVGVPPRPPIAPPPTIPPVANGSTVVRLPRAQITNGSPTLQSLVEEAHRKSFSDVHLGVGKVPRFRNRGEIMATEYPVTDDETFMAWMQEVLSDLEIQRFRETLDFDGAAQYPFARVRINIFETLTGPAMVLRLIPMQIATFEQLNLPTTFAEVCHEHKGLILITGPTGSGKSTTLAAMVDYINRTMPRHIITIEDPIEFVHQSHRSIISQREVGIHSLEFDRALKASLREDPDVILIGEMRDRETVETALKAAQTGHLVFGTLHTNGAVKTLERILALYQPNERDTVRVQIAESLVSVISQGLVPTTDGKRAPFFEVMLNTDAIRDYIKKGEVEEIENIIPRSNYQGMCTMNQVLFRLYEEGRISEEIALDFSPQTHEMAIMLRGGTV